MNRIQLRRAGVVLSLCVATACIGAPQRASAQETRLDSIRAAAAAAAAEGAVDTAGAPADTRPTGQQALNPEITVTGDVLALTALDGDETPNFVPREFEVSFQSTLDPYSVAKVFIGYHTHGGGLLPFPEPAPGVPEEEHGHGGEVAVEEGYIRWQGLPGGVNVQLGRFRQSFGQLNRWHPHALPMRTYPLPYVAFFGEEGLAQTGVGVHWLAPFTGFGTWEVWTEVTASSNEHLFGEFNDPSVLGRVHGFWDLSPATYFEVGLSGITGPSMGAGDGFDTHVGGLDFTLSWRPPARARTHEATLRGGLVYGQVEPGGLDPDAAFGAFLNGEYRLDRRWIVGGRLEYTESPLDPTEAAWLAAPTLTWWQSEWVRLRAELDWLERPNETLRLLVLQATFAMGPHKHETY